MEGGGEGGIEERRVTDERGRRKDWMKEAGPTPFVCQDDARTCSGCKLPLLRSGEGSEPFPVTEWSTA